MSKVLREIYGTGIIFFYYTKYFILIGWPLLYFGLEYKRNVIMDILWVFCAALSIKDIFLAWYKSKKRDS
jgi:hypothetical protein